jgi:hypothetical protein
MMMNTPTLPPAALTDDSMRLAAALLQLCADPEAAKSRLDELNTATTTLRAAIDEHAAAKTQVETATAGLADLQQREQNLADRENGLIAAQTKLNVSSAAIEARDQTKLRESASDRRAAEIEARAKALDDRLAAYRQALA